MNIVLLGPPGAGKGTQAARLKNELGFEVIATGDILRAEIAKSSPLGQEVKAIVESGGFPSDAIILRVLEEKLKALPAQKNIVLDGVPRTLNQAEALGPLLSRVGRSLDRVVELTVDIEQLIERLSSRYTCKTCGHLYSSTLRPAQEGVCDQCGGTEFVTRKDDAPEAIQTRFDIYRNQTEPLRSYYAAKHLLVSVDGMQEPQRVFERLREILS